MSDLPDKKVVHGYADFEFLKDHPYLRVDDKVYDIDYEYAAAKLESGALWRVAMSMPTNRRLSYFGFWGDVFEEYVNWIFESYAHTTKNARYSCPRYLNKDNKPICDLLIMRGSTAVLIEAKAATCAASVRYSGDYKLVREYMERRFVEGTDRPVALWSCLSLVGSAWPGQYTATLSVWRLLKVSQSWAFHESSSVFINRRFRQLCSWESPYSC